MSDRTLVVKMDESYHRKLDEICDKQERTRKAVVQRMIEETHRQDCGDTSEAPQDVEGSA